MKKILVTSFILISFVLYSFYKRQDTTSESLSANQLYIKNTKQVLSSSNNKKRFRDGEYIGDVTDAFYGNVQVKAIITNGKLSDVIFLQYPNDRHTSIEINTQAMPILKSEAIQAQSSQVDLVSAATDSSKAFIESLTSALIQSKT